MTGRSTRQSLGFGSGLSGWWVGPDGPDVVVVLVHGAMDRAASFMRVARRLGDPEPATDPDGPEPPGGPPRIAVVAYDRRGYDGSLGVGPGGIDDHAEDLITVADTVEAPTLVVLGHSLGGTVLVRAVDLGLRVDAAAVFEAPLPQLPSYRDDLAAAALAAAGRDGPAAAAETFSRAVLGDRSWERLRPEHREARLAEGPALCTELASLATLGPLGWSRPVAASVGRGDRSGEYHRVVADEAAALLGNGTVVVLEGAGHGAHLSHPDACARWLRTLTTATTGGAAPRT